MPFYPWLHRLAAERVALAYRRHVLSKGRGVGLEEPATTREGCPDTLFADETTPVTRLIRSERESKILGSLDGLPEAERSVLVMRYLEGLSFAEIAAILEINEGAAKMRHLRALQKLRERNAALAPGSSG